MQTTHPLSSKVAYRNGQLLLEQDFIDEQQFLLHARYRQNLGLHGWGVARGLEVTATGSTVQVSPGFAIDQRGREIDLNQPQSIDLQQAGLKPGTTVLLTLGYRSERGAREGGADGDEAIERFRCFALLQTVVEVEGNDIRLAALRLDERSGVTVLALADGGRRDVLPGARPDSIGPASLAPSLRMGWISLAFHPSRLPEDEDGTRPPFRIGATRVLAHKEFKGKKNDRGAGGTMAIPLPPGVRRVLQLLVAGEFNEGEIHVELVKGGIEVTTDKGKKVVGHKRVVLAKGAVKAAPYVERLTVEKDHQVFNRDPDNPSETLSIDIRCTAYASVSLVAVQVSY